MGNFLSFIIVLSHSYEESEKISGLKTVFSHHWSIDLEAQLHS